MAIARHPWWRSRPAHPEARGVVRAVLEADPDFRWRDLMVPTPGEELLIWLRRHGVGVLAVAVSVGVLLTVVISGAI